MSVKNEKYVLSIDIGGTTIKSATIKKDGEIKKIHPSVKTPKNINDFYESISYIKDNYCSNSSNVAIAMPGVINSDNGYVNHGGSLHYISNYPLADNLSKRLNCSVSIINDAKAAALGEQEFGYLKNINNGLSMVLGTAVGLGIIINKELYKGSAFAAGEFSFLNIDNKPGIENIAVPRLSAVNMIDSYFLEKNIDTSDKGSYFFKMVSEDDELAVNLLSSYCQTLAIQLYNLQALFNPETFVIGGGISSQEQIFLYLDKHLDDYSKTIYNLIEKPNVKKSKLGNSANLLGAFVHFEKLKK